MPWLYYRRTYASLGLIELRKFKDTCKLGVILPIQSHCVKPNKSVNHQLQGHTWSMVLTEFIFYQAWSTTVDSKINKILFTFSYLWFQALATGRSCYRDLQFYHRGKYRGNVFMFSPNFTQELILRFCTSACAMSWHGNNLCITGPLWGESIPVVCEDRWLPLGPMWGLVDSLFRTSDAGIWCFFCC